MTAFTPDEEKGGWLCKLCNDALVQYCKGICPQCLPAYQQGVTDATNAAYKSINSELAQMIRMNKSKIL